MEDPETRQQEGKVVKSDVRKLREKDGRSGEQKDCLSKEAIDEELVLSQSCGFQAALVFGGLQLLVQPRNTQTAVKHPGRGRILWLKKTR
jgi:hypothetical protein